MIPFDFTWGRYFLDPSWFIQPKTPLIEKSPKWLISYYFLHETWDFRKLTKRTPMSGVPPQLKVGAPN